MENMFLPYLRYFEFGGRSTRSEYWMFTLFLWLVLTVLFVAGGGMEVFAASNPEEALFYALTGIPFLLAAIFLLFSFIPALAVTIRRFHDAGFSGWAYVGLVVVSMIPLVGLLANLAMFVISVLPSVANNKWGDNPHDDWGRGSNFGYERPETVRYR